jgi:hypothetical protein
MHEPAACGARPSQHASIHIGPLATAAAGKTLAKIQANNAALRKIRAT